MRLLKSLAMALAVWSGGTAASAAVAQFTEIDFNDFAVGTYDAGQAIEYGDYWLRPEVDMLVAAPNRIDPGDNRAVFQLNEPLPRQSLRITRKDGNAFTFLSADLRRDYSFQDNSVDLISGARYGFEGVSPSDKWFYSGALYNDSFQTITPKTNAVPPVLDFRITLQRAYDSQKQSGVGGAMNKIRLSYVPPPPIFTPTPPVVTPPPPPPPSPVPLPAGAWLLLGGLGGLTLLRRRKAG